MWQSTKKKGKMGRIEYAILAAAGDQKTKFLLKENSTSV